MIISRKQKLKNRKEHREQVLAQRERRKESLDIEFKKLPMKVRSRKVRKYGKNRAKFHIDKYLKLPPPVIKHKPPRPIEGMPKHIDVLFLSIKDWASLGYTLAESLKSVGVNAVAISTQPLLWKDESEQSIIYSYKDKYLARDLAEAAMRSSIIVWMHSSYQELPYDLLKDKKYVVFHGGTNYRKNPVGMNKVFNDKVDLSLVQTGELLNKGAKNEYWLLPPVDTKRIKPKYSFESEDKIIIGHFTSHQGGFKRSLTKGTPLIEFVMDSLEMSELKDRFEFRVGESSQIPWKENLQRMSECDIYIESLSQGVEKGTNKHDWSITALEACALGCITITNFLFEKKYKKEYGEHGLIVANTDNELKKILKKLLTMDRSELLTMKHKARRWVEEKHSYKVIGQRLKDILDGRKEEVEKEEVVISKPLESKRDLIASDLAVCKDVFNRARVPWVIIDGIVLGYVRQKDIMSWDTDVDVAIFQEITDSEWKLIYTGFKEAGFVIRNSKQDFVYGRRNVNLNLWLYHKKGYFYESYPRTTPGIKFVERARWFNKTRMVDFLDEIYPMPNNIMDYIVCHYGKDWMVPRYSHDKWRIEKFGTDSSKLEIDTWLDSRCGPEGDLWPKVMRTENQL